MDKRNFLQANNSWVSPQQVSLVEEAVVNLSKILGDFIGDQKNINIQVNQRIDHVETSDRKSVV